MNRIAAIDLGSNAVRFVLAEYTSGESFKLIKKLREPVRLGHDVFTKGFISKETQSQAITSFRKFKDLINKYEVQAVRAVATSATREADNGVAFAKEVKAQTGIKLSIIDGIQEAHLVHLAVRNEISLKKKKALLIDIGGGSVEVTYSEGNQLTATESFSMGAVRLIEELKKHQYTERELDELLREFARPLRHFILSKKESLPLDFAVGTGGNFDSLGKLKLPLLNKTPNTQITRSELSEIRAKLLETSLDERMDKLNLRKDRADVIVPALAVAEMILKTSQLELLRIPYVGLKEGILWQALEDLEP